MDKGQEREARTESLGSFGPHAGGDFGEWAFFASLVRDDPEQAWARLLKVVSLTDDEGLLWIADVLEDFVIEHPAAFVPKIETELRSNRRLREAFVRFVPSSPDEDVNDRLLSLRESIEREFAD